MLLGHSHVGLFVTSDNDVSGLGGDLDVELEVSPDGQTWATASVPSGSIRVTEADMTQDPDSGLYTAHISAPSPHATYARARVSAYTDGGNVDAYIMGAGNAGQGRKPSDRKGPVTDL